jgi:hypothetical protein
MHLNRVEGFVCPDNKPSIKLLERFHFRQEGILYQRTYWGGKYWDDVCFGLLDHEWDAYQTTIGFEFPKEWQTESVPVPRPVKRQR